MFQPQAWNLAVGVGVTSLALGLQLGEGIGRRSGRRGLQRLTRTTAPRPLQPGPAGGGWIEDRLGRAGWRLKPAEFALAWTGAIGLGAAGGWSLGGTLGLLSGMTLGGALPWWLVRRVAAGRRRATEGALEVFLVGVAAAQKAGLSLVQSLQNARVEAGQPLDGELEQVLAEYEVGVPLLEALQGLRQRIPSEEVGLFLAALEVNQASGGRLTEVLSHLAETVRQRRLSRLDLAAKTAEVRYSAVVIAMVPPFLGAYLYHYESRLFSPLLTDPVGRLAFGLAALLWCAGVLVSRQVVEVKEVR